ncbi:MAG: SusC/RagA family TonB-linked outer membrane protein [Bacteroidales bacterium]|nr:SusC/RagA family TonB-linked outer membrane protein [Bacteroidales bacterium]
MFLLPASLAAQQVDTVVAASHTVTREQMNKGLVTNGLDALNGQSAGVTISGGNQAAMLSAVRVRGTTSLTGGNDPLIIIDGVTSDIATLCSLYPGDIDSFTVLKDASETAQYGSRGASGVIRVTTIKGRGGDFHVSYDATCGFERTYKNLQMLSAARFREVNDARGYSFSDGGYDSDMLGSILRTGTVQDHHLAFGGGSETSHFRASIGLLDHRQVVQTQNNKNYNVKLDVGQSAFEGRMEFDFGIFASLQRLAELHDPQHLFYSSAAFNPTFLAGQNKDGSYSQIPSASQINNPVSLLEKTYNTENAHFNTHLQMAAHLTKELTLTAFASYSYNAGGASHFFPSIIWSGGEAYRNSEIIRDGIASLVLDYKKTLGAHSFGATFLTEAQQTVSSGFYVTTTGFKTNAFGLSAIQAGSVRPWDGTASYDADVRLLSFMAEANYSYRGVYSIAASLRADASSKFGPNNRWGLFPSVSGSWLASGEDFLKDVEWLSNLKFNAGFGLSGNQGALGPYNSLELVEPTSVVNLDGNPEVAFSIIRNANPDLKWEVRQSVNVGMESAFADNRVVFTAEYYYSLTRDMLYDYQVSVPPFAYDHLMANLGKMSNSGFEFGLGVNVIRRNDMQLNVNMNMSLQRNKLISLSGYWQGQLLEAPEVAGIASMNGAGFHGGDNDVTYQIVGQPLGVFYLPHCTGLAQAADGTYYYETDGENHLCGQASPKALLGSNISFRYKAVDISVQANGAFGHKIFNGTALTYMNMGSLPYYNVFADAPQANIVDQTVTDYWLEKGDYLNIDYVTVGWNVPLRGILRNLRISASVNNLLTITGYSGLSPMINSYVAGPTFGLDDKISYPVYRSFTAGISIQF